jgi:isohexenylglutaconyl-CoA hydratase
MPESTLLIEKKEHALHVTFNRPKVRNAMSLELVEELSACLTDAARNEAIRVIVLRGAEGHFCAGGDISDMAKARQLAAGGDNNAYVNFNRRFGELLEQANAQPQVVITVLEGAVLGGGFGLACISDIAIATPDCQFGLPETGLGIIPAQIAPFVVERVGLTQARKLSLTGARFKGEEALSLGLVHDVVPADQLDATLAAYLKRIKSCAPGANRVTKQLLMEVGKKPMKQVLDEAAIAFSHAVTGEEGMEGTMAFMQKRPPKWAE